MNMSAQNDAGVEFSILPEEKQQHFRLLELPAEILSLVASQDAPMLRLKSTENPAGNNNVVLCTSTKTYELRQVSTSNSLFVAQTTESLHDGDLMFQPQLQAIAQVQSTLEILKPTQSSAHSHVAAVVPTYTSTGHYSQKDKMTKDELFAKIPLSQAECEMGWRELACFELGYESHCVVPSATMKLKAWESILGAATAAGIDLTVPLDRIQLSEALANVDSDWPKELYVAILQSMSTSQSPTDELVLDADTCARVSGNALLRDVTDDLGTSVSLHSFNSRWADLLPESWRSHAKLGLIEGSYRLENGGQEICFVGDHLGGAADSDGTAKADASSNLGAKRKWHEKFRATKKAG